ncbi:MAG: glycerol-3-phosphate acyltransferase [Acidimicrobiia bacterium]
MSDDAVVAILVPVAYLLGTFPSAELVARRRGVDVTAAGSGNPGASNTFRLLGWRAGAIVFALDAAKGAAAALAGLLIEGRAGALVLGIAAIVGHMLPVTRRLKGGRGVATAAGVLLVLYPLIVLGSVVAWLVIARVTHMASVASIIVAIAVPIAAALTGSTWWEVVVLAAVSLLVVVRHASNLRRLVLGQELGLDPGLDPGGSAGSAGPDDDPNA